MLVQYIVLGREDHIGGFLLHVFLNERNSNAGQPCAECSEPAEKSAVERAEEARHALHIENVGEVLGGAPRCFGTEGFVGELNQRHLVAGVLQHAIQFSLLPAFVRGLQFSRSPL
jgi:hypothetical protein